MRNEHKYLARIVELPWKTKTEPTGTRACEAAKRRRLLSPARTQEAGNLHTINHVRVFQDISNVETLPEKRLSKPSELPATTVSTYGRTY